MFDPSDYPTAPKEAQHVPGLPIVWCLACGGQGWVMARRGTEWCEECGGSGEPRQETGQTAAFLVVMAACWGFALVCVLAVAWGVHLVRSPH